MKYCKIFNDVNTLVALIETLILWGVTHATPILKQYLNLPTYFCLKMTTDVLFYLKDVIIITVCKNNVINVFSTL